ncbi:hypothetical protein J1605_013155 [Eschrichtius robustus]|uniref:Uncharacterized protein n=1 Tax=Eschrichtius robustus TaxID=9764 RepID=A0AB34GH14_ESCRO|nr:hypothetical protein J1605_013155 [Eschrichtius robustus]
MPLSCPRYPNSWTVLLAVSGQRQAASGWDRGLELFQEEVSSWDTQLSAVYLLKQIKKGKRKRTPLAAPLQDPQADAFSSPHRQSQPPKFDAHAQVLQLLRPHVFFPVNPRLRLPRVPASSRPDCPFCCRPGLPSVMACNLPPPSFRPPLPKSGPSTHPAIDRASPQKPRAGDAPRSLRLPAGEGTLAMTRERHSPHTLNPTSAHSGNPSCTPAVSASDTASAETES